MTEADKVTAELMALHDRATLLHGHAMDEPNGGTVLAANEARASLEQAIRRAVDWGEPVAFVTEADQRCFHSGPGESIFLFTKKAKWNVPLYARNKP